LLKAIHLLSFAVWTAASLGAYLVIRDICNDDVLAKYRPVAHLQALALGATGLTMTHMLGFPSLTKTAALLYGPLAALELLYNIGNEKLRKAEQMGQHLDAHVDSATCNHPIPQALQTHTRPLTQAAARPAARHTEKTGTTTSQRDGTYMRYSSIYAKPVRACGRTTSPVFNSNYVYSQKLIIKSSI
jgi:hypothetical protein